MISLEIGTCWRLPKKVTWAQKRCWKEVWLVFLLPSPIYLAEASLLFSGKLFSSHLAVTAAFGAAKIYAQY